MTFAEIVLQKLADWQPPGDGRHTLMVPDESSGWTLLVTVDRRDDLGCLLWEVVLQRAPGVQPDATLTSWARQAAERVRGLLEPLQVVEIDLLRNEALLRSDEPDRRGEKLAYHEVLMQGTYRATLRRFQAPHREGRREQIPFALTHEALAKVALELAGAP
jgi:hypothetical protein